MKKISSENVELKRHYGMNHAPVLKKQSDHLKENGNALLSVQVRSRIIKFFFTVRFKKNKIPWQIWRRLWLKTR
jgi:hypothetical protein